MQIILKNLPMKISIFENWNTAIWVDYSSRADCLWVFEITQSEKHQIDNGSTVSIVDNTLVITETDEYVKNQTRVSLKTMSAQDIIDSADNYSDLWIVGKKLWELVSDKIVDWNIYKELQLHRIMIQKLAKVVVDGETLTAEDLATIQAIRDMDTQTELILDKFTPVI